MGNSPHKPTLDEQLREHKRAIERSIRELDRERIRLDGEEKRIVTEIRSAATRGQLNSAKIMARDLVRTRRYIQKFYEMRSQLQAIKLRLQTVKSTQAMSESMKGVAKVMVQLNKQMDVPAVKKILNDFVKQSDKLGFTEDLLGDAVDDVIADEMDEEEEDRVVSQVLDEIGVDLQGQLVNAPKTRIGAEGSSVAAGGAGTTDHKAIAEMDVSLENRLNNLRK